MKALVNRFNSFFTIFVAGLLCWSSSVALAKNFTWTGASDNDVTNGANWNPSLPNFLDSSGPDANVGTVLVFDGTSSTTNITPTYNSTSDMVGMQFNSGAPVLTFGGTGYWKMTSGAAPGIKNSSGVTQTFNTEIGIYATTSAVTGAQLNADTGDIVINGTFHAASEDTRTTRFATIGGAKDVYLHAIANPGTTATVGRIYYNGSGHLILADSGTSYAGDINLQSRTGGVIRATNANSFADSATGSTIVFGGTSTTGGNGSIELASGVGNSMSIAEVFNLAARGGTIASAPHMVNVSGSNTLTGTFAPLAANTGGTHSKVTFESRGTAAGDFLEIAGSYDHSLSTDSGGTGNGLQDLVLTGAGKGKFSGNITASGGDWYVVKSGNGTWEISGTNNYTGNTTVMAGTLSLGATGSIAGSSTIDVRSGATFVTSGLGGSALTLGGTQTLKGTGSVTGGIATSSGSIVAPSGDTGGVGKMSISGNLTLVADSILQYDLTSTAAIADGTNDKIGVGGSLTLPSSGTATIAVNMTNGVLGNGTYRLMDYSGAALTTGDLAKFTVNGVTLSARQTSANLTSPAAGQLNLQVVGGPASLTWVGNAGNTWADGNAVPVNWSGAPGPAFDNHFYNADSVTFDNSGATTVNVSGTVAPGNVNFTNNAGHDYAIGGGTINAISMNMTGSGNVNVTSGNFTVTNSVAMSGTGRFTFSNSGGLIALPATTAINSGTVAINRTDDLTSAAAVTTKLTGAGAFLKQNTNIVEVSGDNSGFTGTATVEAGTLRITNRLSTTNTTVQSGATLQFDVGTAGDIVFGGGTKAIAISGAGAAGTSGALVAAPTSGSDGINPHLGNLTLNGDATIYAGNNGGTGRSIIWFEGAINGNNHNLTAIADTSVAGSEIDFLNNGVVNNLNNLTIAGNGTVYFGRNTDLGNSGSIILGNGTTNGRLGVYTTPYVDGLTVPLNKPISVTAGSVGGFEVYYNAANSFGSPITLNTDSRLDMILFTRTNATKSTVTLTGAITGPGALALHTDANATNTRLGLVQLTSNSNAFSGPITVGGGGGSYNTVADNDRISLSIGNGGATGSIGGGDITVTSVSGASSSDDPLDATGLAASSLILNRTGTYALTNNIALLGGDSVSRIQAIGAGNASISGVVSGTGKIVVNNAAGSLTLSGANTYTGVTTVNSGKLLVNGTHMGGGAYTVNGPLGDYNLNGVVDGADYVLWRKNPGDYGGDPDGYNTWRQNFGTGAGTLGGIGTIASGVTVNLGATLAPGDGANLSPFTVDNADINGKLLIDYNGDTDTIDQLIASSSLDIGDGTVDFHNLGVGALNGGPHVFASYVTLVGDHFSSELHVPAGYTIDYHYNLGTQIALVASGAGASFGSVGGVPEPAALMLIVFGALGALLVRKR